METTQHRAEWTPKTRIVFKAFELYWAPQGSCIATVYASSARAAIRKAPAPWSKYLGEIYAIEVAQ